MVPRKLTRSRRFAKNERRRYCSAQNNPGGGRTRSTIHAARAAVSLVGGIDLLVPPHKRTRIVLAVSLLDGGRLRRRTNHKVLASVGWSPVCRRRRLDAHHLAWGNADD